MAPAPKLFPVELNIAVLVEDARAKDLGGFYVIAASMGKADGRAIPAGVAEPDDIGLSRQGAVSVAHTAGESHAGSNALFRKRFFRISIGGSHVAVAKTDSIEGYDWCTGGKVYIAFGNMAVWLKVIRSYLVALNVSLSLGFF